MNLAGIRGRRVGIFDPLLFGYFWQGNTQRKANAKFRFKPVE